MIIKTILFRNTDVMYKKSCDKLKVHTQLTSPLNGDVPVKWADEHLTMDIV